MVIKSVWFATEDHLKRFAKMAKAAGLIRKVFAGLKMPDNFPQVQIQNRVIPLIYLSQGLLQINGDELAYTAEPPVPWPDTVFLHTVDDLKLKVKKEQILEIKRFKSTSGTKTFTLNWISLRYRDGEKPTEILLCAGNKGLLMKNINSDTDKLYKHLTKFAKS